MLKLQRKQQPECTSPFLLDERVYIDLEELRRSVQAAKRLYAEMNDLSAEELDALKELWSQRAHVVKNK